jgi:hypothetical protein
MAMIDFLIADVILSEAKNPCNLPVDAKMWARHVKDS